MPLEIVSIGPIGGDRIWSPRRHWLVRIAPRGKKKGKLMSQDLPDSEPSRSRTKQASGKFDLGTQPNQRLLHYYATSITLSDASSGR
jgi:hypothetical protein